MEDALQDPLKEQAFICNLQSHWLAVRKLNGQWWNLNSLEKRPQFLSDIYLGYVLNANHQNASYRELIRNNSSQSIP